MAWADLSKAKIDELSLLDLAAYVCGMDTDHYEESEIDDALVEHYGIDFAAFSKLIIVLAPSIAVGQTLGGVYKGFGANGVFFVRIPLNP